MRSLKAAHYWMKHHINIDCSLGSKQGPKNVTRLGRQNILRRSCIYILILSKKVYMYMCPIPNGFRDRAISLYSALYTVQTSNTPCPHTSCKVHWCWLWNFQKCIILGKLYQLRHLNNKYRLSRKPFGIGHMFIYEQFFA
jgi:hypothetical protein